MKIRVENNEWFIAFSMPVWAYVSLYQRAVWSDGRGMRGNSTKMHEFVCENTYILLGVQISLRSICLKNEIVS